MSSPPAETPAREHKTRSRARPGGIAIEKVAGSEGASPYSYWYEYFFLRSGLPLDAPFEAPPPPEEETRAIAESIARFEVGESGDGRRLRRLAAATGDPVYAATIDLFVKEENAHAHWLGILRRRFSGEQLSAHWSERAFVLLRHLGGLKLELCVLLAAEVTALTYYGTLAQASADPALGAACRRVLIDERGHVAFHRATLGQEFRSLGPARRRLSALAWRSFVAVTAMAVAWDHRLVLRAAGMQRRLFVADVRGRARRLARVMHSPGLFEGPASLGRRPASLTFRG